MFLSLPDPLTVNDDWLTIGFEVRLGELRRGRVRVALYYDYPDSSTFRYRVHNVVEVLRAHHAGQEPPEISAAWFCHADEARLDAVAEAADILVVCRARYSARINGLITRAKNLDRSVVFDVDDLVVDPQFAHLIVHTLDKNIHGEDTWNYWFGYIGRLRATMLMCDRVVTTNAFLADQIGRSSGLSVSVVPNFLNREQLDYADRIYEAKQDAGFRRDAHTQIGYFSGSPSHNKDFRVASGALAALMKQDRTLRLLLVGYLDLHGPLTAYADRIDKLPMQDYLNLQRVIGSAEINIVPLQDNVFTNCKSELKYFEAAVVGTATLASPTFVFREGIEDGRNGWLVESQSWYDKLGSALALLRDDPSEVFALNARAREDARSRFSWENQYAVVRAALLGP